MPEYVFTATSRGAEGKQLQSRYIQDMVSRYSKRAGIKKRFSPHTLVGSDVEKALSGGNGGYLIRFERSGIKTTD